MTRHAHIDSSNNVVINVIELDPDNVCLEPVPECLKWHVPTGTIVVPSETANIGEIYNPGDGEFAAPAPVPEELDFERFSNVRDHVLLSDTAGFVATNAPAAGVEVPGTRHIIPTYGAQAGRVGFSSSIANPAIRVRIRYSLDKGQNWSNGMLQEATDAEGLSIGPWLLLPAAMRDRDILVSARVLGDGTVTSTIRKIYIQLM